MKTLILLACMSVSSVAAAQDTVYDYQGEVMTGTGGPQTFPAQMDFIGPIRAPELNAGGALSPMMLLFCGKHRLTPV